MEVGAVFADDVERTERAILSDCLFEILASTRSAVASQRPLSRNCAAPGLNDLPASSGEWWRQMDLHMCYKAAELGIELKVWREGKPDPLKQGLEQLDEYLNGLGLTTGWLVIFDQRAGLSDISERTSAIEAQTPSGRSVTVIRG